ncbi:alpha/beta hydrolase [Nocardia cyriacigeorgica]|uniref:alpha/beta hydrolase n=1 Tax=Nocardia cyriacigeorgica TaxID=135487 RepID=UPI002456C7B7|nr:alpha/beta hydrolase [Nocardia cyriacigeorgica]
MDVKRVGFRSGGIDCAATIYRDSAESERPGVLLCPGFGGTQDTPSIEASARTFAAAGYVAVTFDYRNFGSSRGEPRQLVDISGQIADIHAATALTRELDEVDPDRVALWGTSLGGGHVVTAAAEEPGIAAVVAQIPFNGFPKQASGRSRKATSALLAAMVRDRLRGWTGRAPYYIPAVGETGDVAVMTGPQAAKTIAAMHSATWENKVAPRALLDMMRYKPETSARRLRMPLMVCVGEFDHETPDSDSSRLAEVAPNGTLRRYPVGHFDFYRPDVREKVLADQLGFLDSVLLRND